MQTLDNLQRNMSALAVVMEPQEQKIVKNVGGRPLKFITVKALQTAIDVYFVSCAESKEPLTITGLALALDTSRETLMDYQVRDGFSDAVKRAKLMIEQSYELRNIKRGNGGDIFALKQFGWKDKSEVVNTNMNFDAVAYIREVERRNSQLR